MHEVAVHGDFEDSTIQALAAYSRPGGVAIDVGANIGLISLAALRAEKDLVVHAFEPSPNVLDYLRRTREMSGFSERWTIHASACADQSGKAEFCLAAPAQGAYDGLRETGRVGIVRRVSVPVVRLDDEWAVWGKPGIDWIKIDVEGAEAGVFLGMESIVRICRPVIVSEWNLVNLAAYRTDPQWLFSFAAQNRYRIFDPATLVRIESVEFVRMMLHCGRDTLLLVPYERLESESHA
ncbi:MAG TPA: FkbM family methyltransferase [Bryobacteraceae bacterium]|nr:FkbM family methyltransferase [Bryobacteraceae bacterium]